jgi:hypothetical protein
LPAAVAATATRVEAQDRAAAARTAKSTSEQHRDAHQAKPDAKPSRRTPAAADAVGGKRG